MSENNNNNQISEEAIIMHLGKRELETIMRDETIRVLADQLAQLKKKEDDTESK